MTAEPTPVVGRIELRCPRCGASASIEGNRAWLDAQRARVEAGHTERCPAPLVETRPT